MEANWNCSENCTQTPKFDLLFMWGKHSQFLCQTQWNTQRSDSIWFQIFQWNDTHYHVKKRHSKSVIVITQQNFENSSPTYLSHVYCLWKQYMNLKAAKTLEIIVLQLISLWNFCPSLKQFSHSRFRSFLKKMRCEVLFNSLDSFYVPLKCLSCLYNIPPVMFVTNSAH